MLSIGQNPGQASKQCHPVAVAIAGVATWDCAPNQNDIPRYKCHQHSHDDREPPLQTVRGSSIFSLALYIVTDLSCLWTAARLHVQFAQTS
eukprot:652973-Pleurochrysis_carterae.AAC.1